jgi:hypothetical protein
MKARILAVKWELIVWVLSALLQAASFGYFLGRLSQDVHNVDSRVERIERFLDTKEARR